MSESTQVTPEGVVLRGKYKLQELLGFGGMGEVFRAENLGMGRTVAIKRLLSVHAQDSAVVARFLQEARAANVVRHPNVVDVLDIDQDENGTPFIVQEFLTGCDVAQLLAHKGPLSVGEALALLIPICDAVGFAHEKGVVHRDIKPDNIFLARVGTLVVPKLLDFGISRLASDQGDHRLTTGGMALGTPAYMSPEQIMDSRRVDARTDVWALGVTLYELISGSLPFAEETVAATYVRIASPEPVEINSETLHAPSVLTDIIAECLEKDPTRRFANGRELGEALKGAAKMMRQSIQVPSPIELPKENVAVGGARDFPKLDATDAMSSSTQVERESTEAISGATHPAISNQRLGRAATEALPKPAVVPDLALPRSLPKSEKQKAPALQSPEPVARGAKEQTPKKDAFEVNLSIPPPEPALQRVRANARAEERVARVEKRTSTMVDLMSSLWFGLVLFGSLAASYFVARDWTPKPIWPRLHVWLRGLEGYTALVLGGVGLAVTIVMLIFALSQEKRSLLLSWLTFTIGLGVTSGLTFATFIQPNTHDVADMVLQPATGIARMAGPLFGWALTLMPFGAFIANGLYSWRTVSQSSFGEKAYGTVYGILAGGLVYTFAYVLRCAMAG